MRVKISVVQDLRYEKEGNLYPLKLRVYCSGKPPALYQTVYDLTREDFEKFGAKRINDSLITIRDKIKELEQAAQTVADDITPFDFQRFYQEFVYGHPLFIQKKAKIDQLVKNDLSETYPEEWIKKFPILKEVHPGPDYISKVYCTIIRNMLHEDRIGNASSYQCSYNSLKAFKGNVRFKEITKQYLKDYDAWMKDKGNSKTTVGIYVRSLRAVVNEAIELKLMKADDYPFGRRRFVIPAGKNVKKALEKPVIETLYYAKTLTISEDKARDFWFFGYYCVGINPKDIIELQFKNIEGQFLKYERGKTINTKSGKEPTLISVYMNDDIIRIINKLGNQDRNPENYIFPILRPGMSAIEIFECKHNFYRWINKNMAKICKQEGIAQKVKTMEYRHSSATIMKNAGVAGHYIKDLMGHTNLQTQENYFGSFENSQQMEFAKVLDSFKTEQRVLPNEPLRRRSPAA